jgi:hypothetical protein
MPTGFMWKPHSCHAQGELAVAFVGNRDFRSWESYQHGGGYLGSEAYWAAALHRMLQMLNVSVDFIHTPGLQWDSKAAGVAKRSLIIDANILRRAASKRRYHRLFLAGWAQERLEAMARSLDAELLCRTRIMAWWDVGVTGHEEMLGFDNLQDLEALERGCSPTCSHRYTSRGHNATDAPMIDPRLIMTPHANGISSHIPYFPHSLLTLPPSTEASRPRAGFVLGKNCGQLNRHPRLLTALLDAGFEMHSTAKCEHLWPKIIRHGMLPPSGFAMLLRNVSFLVGVGAVAVSPSPIEAMANGAAYLMPGNRTGTGRFHYQHPPLAGVGAPYVYNYDASDARQLIDAADRATRHRFASYVPAAFRLENALGSVCANLMDSDAPCECTKAQAAGDHAYPGCRTVNVHTLPNIITSTDDGADLIESVEK